MISCGDEIFWAKQIDMLQKTIFGQPLVQEIIRRAFRDTEIVSKNLRSWAKNLEHHSERFFKISTDGKRFVMYNFLEEYETKRRVSWGTNSGLLIPLSFFLSYSDFPDSPPQPPPPTRFTAFHSQVKWAFALHTHSCIPPSPFLSESSFGMVASTLWWENYHRR